MVLDKSDLDLSRQVDMLGTYSTESFEKKVLEKYLKKDQTFLDIGANIGFYSLLAGNIVGRKGRIFSFEASSENIDLLKMSIRENSFNTITVIHSAVSNVVGKGFLYVSSYYNSEHSLFDYHYSSGKNNGKKISVKLDTVDNFLQSNYDDLNVNVIKMDIEGSENNALDGMTNTIHDNERLVMITEFWPLGLKNSGTEPREFLEKLYSFGFEIHHIDEYYDRSYPVTIREMLEIVQKRQENPLEKPKEIQSGGWYTNLLCIKRKKI